MSTCAIPQHHPMPGPPGGLLSFQTATARPDILAPAASLAFPSFENIPVRYSASDGLACVNAVASALLRAGAAQTDSFQKKIANGFPPADQMVSTLFTSWCESLDPNGCAQYVDIGFSITDFGAEAGDLGNVKSPVIAFVAEADTCEGLRLNDVLATLRRQSPRLAEAFYRQLTHALNGMTYVYDQDGAEALREYILEGFEGNLEPDQTVEEYMAEEGITIIPPDNRRPAWLPAFKSPSDAQSKKDRAILRNAGSPRLQKWCDDVLTLATLSARAGWKARRKGTNAELADSLREMEMWDDSRPLPTLLIHFDDDDGIVQAFDEEQASYLERSHEPDFLAVAHADNHKDIDRAMKMFADYFRFHCVLTGLVRSIKAWQQK